MNLPPSKYNAYLPGSNKGGNVNQNQNQKLIII